MRMRGLAVAPALLGVALALLGLDAGSAHGQQPDAPCGLTSVTPGAELVYPPIAKAAHVSGTVIVMTRFSTNGTVEATRTLSGPPLLEKSAIEYVKSWRANSYGGPRECPVVVRFEIGDPDQPFPHGDIQHYTVRAFPIVLSDPGGVVCRRILFFQRCRGGL